ncbi:MAG: hypothetical protein IT381_06380 [Deltaproteobacteria bacterium]|nr:hypothetical protein [Deltaproteobacteria bacterium]
MESLAFMVGRWEAQQGAKTSEELWLPERGNLMLGLSRTVERHPSTFESASFEYMRIENRKMGVTLVASPSGRNPTEFALVKSGAKEAVFENLKHDFPQRIRYWLDEQGRLNAKIEDKDGKKSQTWAWMRKPL